MERGLQGRYEILRVGGEEVHSFIPNELPLKHPLQLNAEISKKLDNALVSLGRLLISLLLYENKILQKPLLYLSLYFKIHRQEYYELLTNVRVKGDWEKWIDFFADAVIYASNQAVRTARNLINLINDDEAKVSNIGRASSTALTVYRCFVKILY